MPDPEFNASEIIAGFPLTEVKRALAWVGVLEDRDDIENVRQALNCRAHQAERLLEALERRGLVAKTEKHPQWETTQLGNRLVYHWKPPRRMHPAIEREEESGVHGESFESVPCFVYRIDSDDGGAFEECEFDVGISVEFETDRIVEINVVQPDFYDERNTSSTIEQSIYVGIDEARKLAKGLQTAIDRAEQELARRKAAPRLTRQRSKRGRKRLIARSTGLKRRHRTQRRARTPDRRRRIHRRRHGPSRPPRILRAPKQTASALRIFSRQL